MLYRIANILIEIKGLQNEYLERRLGAYLATDKHATPDIVVTFKENKEIEVPTGRDFRRLDSWYWIDRGTEGYTAIKQHSVTRLNISRMDFDKSCKNITIEYFDINDIYTNITTDRALHIILGDAFAFSQTLFGNILFIQESPSSPLAFSLLVSGAGS